MCFRTYPKPTVGSGFRVISRRSDTIRFIALLLCTAAVGCSSDNCAVSGRVTLDGEALSNGRIALRPSAQMAASRPQSAKIDNGEFSFARSLGIASGSYIVTITTYRKTGRKLKVDEAEALDEHEQYLPEEYNTRSQISVNIRGNTSGLRFDLKMPEPESPTEGESPEPEKGTSESE